MFSAQNIKKINEFDESLIYNSKSIEKIRQYFTKFEGYEVLLKDGNEENFKHFRAQLSFTGFLTISMIDLLVIAKGTLKTSQKWEQLHQLKLGYLVIYEVLNTYSSHSEYLKKTSATNEKSTKLFSSITTLLKNFKKEYDYPNSFKKVRNFTIGHFDSNFTEYFDILNQLDVEKSFSAILDFIKILTKLNELATGLSFALKLNVDGITREITQMR